MRLRAIASLASLIAATSLGAQARTLAPQLKNFASVDAPLVAITHAILIDGTGAGPRADMTIVITGEQVSAVGPSSSVAIPAGAQVVDAAGMTVMPGIIGLHDHMYYSSAAGGSMRAMFQSYPRLFLANGVTTIRTAGSVDSYQELNLKARIDAGQVVGPTMFVTGPYLQGAGGGLPAMPVLTNPEAARRLVRYWSEEGVSWFKAYTTITRAELGAAIDEAHKHGVKVTAHLCSVGYREAVALGIDNLEHGLFANSEYYKEKQPDVCPAVGDAVLFANATTDNPDVQRTIAEMVARKVSLTSTLAVYETSTPSRVKRDPRILEALMPDAATAIDKWYETGATRDDAVGRAVLRKTMDFERAFAKAGGLLGAGSDPCCLHAIAGFADQRNYEMLVEAGFSAGEAVQVMTQNGARILGVDKKVGSVAPGMQADLILLRGDLAANPETIRNTVTVFRKGIGFDSAKLLASVKGQVGLR